MKKSRALIGAASVVVGASVLAFAPHSSAGPRPAASTASSGHAVASAKVSAASAKAAAAYWTPERMKSAKSADVARPGSPGPAAQTAAKPTGAPGRVAGRTPAGATAASSARAGSTAAQPAAFSYPFPYDNFPVATNLYKPYPRSINGKIFFVNNGGHFVCSGTSVTTPNGNEVWTAGHCVSNTGASTSGGVFDSSALFVPAYNGNGTTGAQVAPYGTWSATQFATWSSWLNSADFSHDLGAFTVVPNQGSGTLAGRVGTDGFAWNQNANQQFVTFGWPAASPFNGLSEYEDIGATATQDTSIGGASNHPTGIGSPLTGGSSGGAWNIGWSDSGPGWINGHNDYKYGSQPEAMYSPYFDDSANTVRCIMQPSGC